MQLFSITTFGICPMYLFKDTKSILLFYSIRILFEISLFFIPQNCSALNCKLIQYNVFFFFQVKIWKNYLLSGGIHSLKWYTLKHWKVLNLFLCSVAVGIYNVYSKYIYFFTNIKLVLHMDWPLNFNHKLVNSARSII